MSTNQEGTVVQFDQEQVIHRNLVMFVSNCNVNTWYIYTVYIVTFITLSVSLYFNY